MKIKVLVENTPSEEKFEYEHGLSLLVEANNKKILVDAGQSDKFLKNADTLSESLLDIDFAVLSHGHYDHADGFEYFLSHNRTAPLYMNSNALGDAFNGERYIGVCDSVKRSDRLILTADYKKICDGFELFTFNNENPAIPIDSAGLSACYDGKVMPERFIHEHYLLIKENGRRIVISSCSHKGVVNIVRWLSPDIFIGGFHFKGIDLSDGKSEILDDCADNLLKSNTQFYTCHCTGVPQYEYLKVKMGDRISYISSGMCFEV